MDEGIIAALLGLTFIFLIFGLCVYLYTAFALMTIAKRTKTKNEWLAFIPIANIYLITQIANLPAWYTLVVLLPIIPFLGTLACIIAMGYIFWKMAERLKRPNWWGILLLVPFVNFVIIGIMAWGKK